MDNILKIENLVISYGAIQAVKSINMQVNKGGIVALLGAYGAGKSTILRAISGVIKPKSGKIIFDGKEIQGLIPNKIAQMGIISSPEGRLIMKDLTVEENLKVGAFSLRKQTVSNTRDDKQKMSLSVHQQMKNNFEQVYRYFPILQERKKQMASTLSGGEQQMLAIGRALMASPKLIILDEPSLGLAPLIVQEIFKIIGEISKNGTTILIVEQNAYQALKIADYAYVMNLGKISIEGTGKDLIDDKSLIAAYLGENN
jgi:branched-chain amino acid transport system ATP-binding protein